jgi:hypothetical protein
VCHEICNVPPCDIRCDNILKCGHRCNGLCGENCPPCMECDKQKPEDEQWRCTIMYESSGEMDLNEPRLYTLPDCGHTFCIEAVDNHMSTSVDHQGHKNIGHKKCPLCGVAIVSARRYQSAIKQNFVKIETVKAAILKQREEELRKQQAASISEVIKVVTRNEVGNQGGHWFECPNGHPYLIGECGGAMQVSKCPDCGVPVGGTSHQLLPSNNRAAAIEGDNAPAWPTALDR